MTRYKTTQGEYISKEYIDRKINDAKGKKIYKHIEEYGYLFCEKCKRSNGVRIDCSHIISVKECQESGQSEKAFDVDNIKLLCRNCHQEHDKLNLQWK